MNDSTINLNEARKYILELMPQAGEILKKYFNSGNFTSQSKGGADLLTQADMEADQFLASSIRQRFPQCEVLTEETAPKDYSSLKEVSNLWVVDPLDGTINFSRGTPHFSISVGLVDRGISRLGVVYDPNGNSLYWAQEDRDGAYLNDRKLRVSGTANLLETVIACDWGWDLQERLKLVKWLGSIAPEVRQIKSMGSAVLDLARLADGKVDTYIHSGLKPWDTAASSLLIEKAGGKITTPEGEKWNVFNPQMLATNGILHDKLLELIRR
jgi:myo-inositol-1(or 4)-monophosphatase